MGKRVVFIDVHRLFHRFLMIFIHFCCRSTCFGLQKGVRSSSDASGAYAEHPSREADSHRAHPARGEDGVLAAVASAFSMRMSGHGTVLRGRQS